MGLKVAEMWLSCTCVLCVGKLSFVQCRLIIDLKRRVVKIIVKNVKVNKNSNFP